MTDSYFPASKRTIMVVDDDPRLVEILRAMLEGKNLNVMCMNGGQQLFDSLEEQKPDLIFLDIMMPHMDGFQVLKQLKGNPETASIPIIMLTAMVQYEDLLEGYKLGANYYITKPFTRAELLEGIKLVLSGDKKHSNQAKQFIKA